MYYNKKIKILTLYSEDRVSGSTKTNAQFVLKGDPIFIKSFALRFADPRTQALPIGNPNYYISFNNINIIKSTSDQLGTFIVSSYAGFTVYEPVYFFNNPYGYMPLKSFTVRWFIESGNTYPFNEASANDVWTLAIYYTDEDD